MNYYPYGQMANPMATMASTNPYLRAPVGTSRATTSTTSSKTTTGNKRDREETNNPLTPTSSGYEGYYAGYPGTAAMYGRTMSSGVKVPRTGASTTTKSTPASNSSKTTASPSRPGGQNNPRLPTALQSSPAAVSVSKPSQQRKGGALGSESSPNSKGSPSSSSNTASSAEGAEFNFNGGWILDKVKSEPMDAYLQAMGLPEQAIQAARKAEEEFDTLNFISYTNGKSIKIRKMSRMGDDTREYESDKEISEAFGRHGQKKVFATCRTNQVEIKTTMPDGKIVVDKRLYEGGDSSVMAQHLTLITAKDQVLVKRWFSRTLMTPDEAKNQK